MRNTAYSDYASHTRFSYLADRGYPFSRFSELGVAPIIFKESLEYLKEIRLFQPFVIKIQLAGLAPDGSRWRIFHEIFADEFRVCLQIFADDLLDFGFLGVIELLGRSHGRTCQHQHHADCGDPPAVT